MDRCAILAAILLLAACGKSEVTLPHGSRPDTVARLEKITQSCGLPSGTLTAVGADQVAVAVRPDADYRKVDCLLEAVHRTKPRLKLGFVGNQAYETGNHN